MIVLIRKLQWPGPLPCQINTTLHGVYFNITRYHIFYFALFISRKYYHVIQPSPSCCSSPCRVATKPMMLMASAVWPKMWLLHLGPGQTSHQHLWSHLAYWIGAYDGVQDPHNLCSHAWNESSWVNQLQCSSFHSLGISQNFQWFYKNFLWKIMSKYLKIY